MWFGGKESGRDSGEGWGWRTSEAEVDEELGRIYSSGQEDALHAEKNDYNRKKL